VTDRSGAGPIELAVLRAAGAGLARGTGPYRVCARLLPRIEAAAGLGPRYGYDVLLDLARPWVINVPLITTQGNAGDRYSPASEPQHLSCRPSRAGALILDAEAGRIAPVPVGLINGTAYRGGLQPALDHERVIAAARHLLARPRAAGRDILAIAGPPHPVTGCLIAGDLDGLAAGRQIIRQTGRITRTSCPVPATAAGRGRAPVAPGAATQIARRPGRTGPRSTAGFHSGFAERAISRAHLVIESLPPGISPARVHQDLDDAARTYDPAAGGRQRPGALPIADLIDASTSKTPVRIAITLRPGADPEAVRDHLAGFDGITTQVPAAYPAPLAPLLRAWTRQHAGEDIAAALTSLEQAIRRDRERRSS
jgi:hypothetical protein